MNKKLLYIEILSLIVFIIFTFFMYLNLNKKIQSIESVDDYAIFNIINEFDLKGNNDDIYFLQSNINIDASYYGNNTYFFKLIFEQLEKTDYNVSLSYDVYSENTLLKTENIDNLNQEKIIIFEDDLIKNEEKNYKIIFKILSNDKRLIEDNSFNAKVLAIKK